MHLSLSAYRISHSPPPARSADVDNTADDSVIEYSAYLCFLAPQAPEIVEYPIWKILSPTSFHYIKGEVDELLVIFQQMLPRSPDRGLR
jgi:hypothetical protein